MSVLANSNPVMVSFKTINYLQSGILYCESGKSVIFRSIASELFMQKGLHCFPLYMFISQVYVTIRITLYIIIHVHINIGTEKQMYDLLLWDPGQNNLLCNNCTFC